MTQTTSQLSVNAGRNLCARYEQTRAFTQQICAPLTPEDCVIQSMPDVSPTRWHLAHTSWFFETFVLGSQAGYQPLQPEFGYLFNSYYNQVGQQFPRSQRGLLSRPGVHEIWDYRRRIDRQMIGFLSSCEEPEVLRIAELGVQHEQQHQELILTDIKHVLSCNPLQPVYRAARARPSRTIGALSWSSYPPGIYEIGHQGSGFAFDNESPRHRQFLQPFELANRPVSNGEYLEFMRDGGYRRSELWLSAGWQIIRERVWEAPLYWQQHDGCWHQFTLAGLCPVDPSEPVCHVSYFEADAFARWADARLPTEAEWEVASGDATGEGALAEACMEPETPVHPPPIGESRVGVSCMLGSVWEWTGSSYAPYPGYRPQRGALGEYNGKFMCNQYVLRGGSCATPASHIRPTYRNFFPPEARWQFSGVRLAR